jgi:predicted nucleic acid-binding protein
MVLVDTNVLLDIVADDERWFEVSRQSLEAEALKGALLINPVVYAELSVRYPSVEAVDAFVSGTGLELAEIPRAALFLAAKAFAAYRHAGGHRTGVLSDFFIGAHAAILNIPILTRDVLKYRTYFPTVELRVPQEPG